LQEAALISFNHFFGGLPVLKHEHKPLAGLNQLLHRKLALPIAPEDHQLVQAISSEVTQAVDFFIRSDSHLKAPLQQIFFQIGLVDDPYEQVLADLKRVLSFHKPV
jgi:hypothetical protein